MQLYTYEHIIRQNKNKQPHTPDFQTPNVETSINRSKSIRLPKTFLWKIFLMLVRKRTLSTAAISVRFQKVVLDCSIKFKSFDLERFSWTHCHNITGKGQLLVNSYWYLFSRTGLQVHFDEFHNVEILRATYVKHQLQVDDGLRLL